MRTLVDQTADEVRKWVSRVSGVDPDGLLPQDGDVHVLMGGTDAGEWIEAPETPAVIVGTQDMLLSRALMRGYASSRAIWPMEFAVLHQDTQWVFDEVQLMGAGRATSAQLEAFRRQEAARALGDRDPAQRPCRSLWVSATLEPEWLKTVDHSAPTKVLRVDPATDADGRLRELAEAPKHLRRSGETLESGNATDQRAYAGRLAESVAEAHRTGRMTLVIVNQVKRAQELYERIRRILDARTGDRPEMALLHSRFRPADREREMARFIGAEGESDIIVIATQAVEAGMDVSAAVMFTELAPWASMVQRFGRANRRAEVEGGAQIHWINLLRGVTSSDKKAEKLASTLSLPYKAEELLDAAAKLSGMEDAAPVHLPPPGEIPTPLRVIRRKDLDDLFDTDPDLTGFDIDISPYVRDADDTDVRVFWREMPVSDEYETIPKPSARELCAVPIGQARIWIDKTRKALGNVFFVRDPQWRRGAGHVDSYPPGWVPLRDAPHPGLTILADVGAGGYDEKLGFTGERRQKPDPVARVDQASAGAGSPATVSGSGGESAGHDQDPKSATGSPVLLTDHTLHVVDEVRDLCEALGVDQGTQAVLIRAARWHDLGKAHEVFQDTMRRGMNGQLLGDDMLLAKTVKNVRHKRYLRHELASALAFLAHEEWARDADLCAFLIAAHHGKVRMNLRALPRESGPAGPERAAARFARGVWEGDLLPELDLGGGEHWPGGELTLSIMELGWDKESRESWTERTRDLLSRYGPFRLAWLEMILRIADWRASAKESAGGYDGT